LKFLLITIFIFGFSLLEAQKISRDYLGEVNGVLLHLPLSEMQIEEFIDRSIGFVPEAIVKDGLPHFGAKRDDWKGATRVHKGYDIYIDHSKVISCADGKVIAVEDGKRSGKYIKIKHKNGVETLYIHLKNTYVKKGQYIKKSQLIAKIDGAVGNAIAPQLHYEIKINGVHQDPLAFIKKQYHQDSKLIRKIKLYETWLQDSIKYRNELIKKALF
jgi:hypothetical protein